jgi:integration host factor subunit beta
MNAALGKLLWLFIAAPFPESAGSPRPPPPPPDLEVVGRVRNLHYEPIHDPDDLLGHGWITARVRISRVVRGRSPSRLITVRYIAHSFRYGGRPVRLRLRADGSGTYTVCAEPGGEGLICG